MGQRVTMEDIARESGVSLATVSLVLRDKPGINTGTRQRVLEAARTMGYRRRPQGDAIGLGRLAQVGVAAKASGDDQPLTNPFYAPVLAGIEATCRARHINMLYAAVPVDLDNHALDLPRMMLEDQLDGIVLVGAFVDRTIDQLLQRGRRPVVLVDAYAVEQAYDAVVSDNFRGAYDAVTYLVRRGHRHIGVVGTMRQTYPSIAERRRGYQQALDEHGIAERYYADSHILDSGATVRATIVELLRSQPQVTALFCANDHFAELTYEAAHATGRTIPDDLSVVGFDDIEPAGRMAPALTTMQVDKTGMGRLAVQLLANRRAAPDAAVVTAVLRPTLVERHSTRSIA